MHTELKPEERRPAAHAEVAGGSSANVPEGPVEPTLPEERGATQAPRPEKTRGNFTPLQLSFSLWLSGLVNAAFSINIIISVMCMFGLGVAFFAKNQMAPRPFSGLVTLSLGLATFSQVGTAVVALLSGLRYVYARYRLKGVTATILVAAVYAVLGSYSVNLLLSQDPKSLMGITVAFALTLANGAVAVWGIRNSDPQKYRQSKPRHKLTVHDFLTWRWNPNLHEDVNEVYASSKAAAAALKGSSEVTRRALALPTDIAGDFKAWNDALKLFITILTGLGIISSLFTEGNGVWDQAVRIVMLLTLLVPALSCVYMEGYRRQCERHWQALGMTQEGE